MKSPVSLGAATLAALLGLSAGLACAGGGDEGRASGMLESMNRALRSLNYEGTLVHLSENRLETLHLVHRVDGGRIQERLVSLSGPVRAVTRERDRVTCVMPDGHPISVKSHAGRNLLRSDRIDPVVLADRYQILIEGVARVAGRDADVLAIKPRDGLRYGYRFHLDRATALPLKSDLIDQMGEPIEQLMFTSLVLHEDADEAEAQAGGQKATEEPTQEDPRPRISTRWRFEAPPRVPAGHVRCAAGPEWCRSRAVRVQRPVVGLLGLHRARCRRRSRWGHADRRRPRGRTADRRTSGHGGR